MGGGGYIVLVIVCTCIYSVQCMYMVNVCV